MVVHQSVIILVNDEYANRNCNLGISRAPFKSQAHQGTSFSQGPAINQRGCSNF